MALVPAQVVSPPRLESVRASGLLDTDRQAAFDRLAALAVMGNSATRSRAAVGQDNVLGLTTCSW